MCIASIALVKMPYLLFSFILHETTLYCPCTSIDGWTVSATKIITLWRAFS